MLDFFKKSTKKHVKLDKEFLQPDSEVREEKFVAPELVEEIERRGREKFIDNLDMGSLFIADEPPGMLATILPWITVGLIFINLLVSFKK